MDRLVAHATRRAGQVLDMAWPRAYGVPVLMYHSISTRPSALAVHPDDFDKQLDWLAANGYQSIWPDELLGAGSEPGANGIGKPVLITFDDGFKDNLYEAAPRLREHGFGATIFISTAYIGSTSTYAAVADDRTFEMLTGAEITELAGAGWTIANHFHNHRVLTELSPTEIQSEFDDACAALGQLGVPDEHQRIVAYPRSRMNEASLAAVAQTGATMAFTGGKRVWVPSDSRWSLPRIGITNDTTISELQLLLAPGYNRVKQARRRVGSLARQTRSLRRPRTR